MSVSGRFALALSALIAQVGEETRGGDSLATPLRKLRMFPSTVIQMISVGDTISNSGGGSDTVFTSDGDNVVYVGGGRDFVFGGNGADRIHGGADRDMIFAGGGPDTVFGGPGSDVSRLVSYPPSACVETVRPGRGRQVLGGRTAAATPPVPAGSRPAA